MATSVIFEYLTAGNVLATVLILGVVGLIANALSAPTYPSFAWVGEGRGLWPWIKGNVTYVLHYSEWVQDGYKKVSFAARQSANKSLTLLQYTKNDKPFIIPGTALQHSQIILPRSQMSWMLEQPDSVLSTWDAQSEALHGRYNFFEARYLDDPYHAKVIHKSLARNLNDMIPGMQEEVEYSIDTVFGLDTEEWKKVNVWKSWLDIVPYITNRMLVGYPLCRNKEWLANCVAFTEDVIRNMFLIGLCPMALRPIFGRLAALPNWWHWKRSSKFSLPIIKQRIHDMQRKEAGDPEYKDWVEPQDFITWTLRLAKEQGNQFESQADTISKRIMPLEFAATHTTSLTGHGVILDLLSSDPALGYLDGIREEAARVLKEDGGKWTKAGLARLIRLDSAIRESMRYSNFAQTLVERKVVAPEGVTHKTEGWHVPKGGFFSLALSGIHHDDDLHKDSETYDAFRYSRPRESYDAKSSDEKDHREELKLKQLGMVTTGVDHLPFGHGRHACPGRFFVAHELKMALAYLFLNYDLKLLPERPKTKWVGPISVPAFETHIELRRRKVAITE